MSEDRHTGSGRISGLDGLRALSIGLVILGHVVETHGFPFRAGGLAHAGNLGVRCFFVISGFLITTLLLKEMSLTGQVSLKNFYARRFLRIVPANFVYIALIYLAFRLQWVDLAAGDMLHALTYTMNYHDARAWDLNHLWSLSVEEQFYILWPGLLVLLGRYAGLRVALAVVILAPLMRWVMWRYLGASESALTREFQAVADSLAAGCLLAGYRDNLIKWNWYARAIQSPWFALVPLLGVGVAVGFGVSAYYLWGQSIANIALALGIDWVIRSRGTIVAAVLNSAPMVWVGILSYSLYLWQEPFLNPAAGGWTARFPVNLLLMSVAAILSYTLVEQPFLRIKTRYSARGRAPPAPRSLAPERPQER